jgi:septum formation protein
MKIERSIILASSSPRRQYLMKEAGFDFVVRKPDVEETFPAEMPVREVAVYLAEKKANFFKNDLADKIVVTADTVVILGDRILNKPETRDEAIAMLGDLSGNTHTVITGVCIMSLEKMISFQDHTDVTFKKLSSNEIAFYVDNYRPYDKAGAYGAQDWIGMVGVHHINGSYFNVMGLPIHLVYQELMNW